MKIKLTNPTRNFLMDELYHERITLNQAKVTLVNDYRIPARKAKILAKELLKDGSRTGMLLSVILSIVLGNA